MADKEHAPPVKVAAFVLQALTSSEEPSPMTSSSAQCKSSQSTCQGDVIPEVLLLNTRALLQLRSNIEVGNPDGQVQQKRQPPCLAAQDGQTRRQKEWNVHGS